MRTTSVGFGGASSVRAVVRRALSAARVLGVAVLGLLVAQCERPEVVTGLNGTESDVAMHVASPSGVLTSEGVQRELLGRIAKAVSIALSDAETRRVVFESLRESPFREHKVHFRSLLTKPDSRLLARMASNGISGSTQSAVLASVDSAIDLELYLPVKSHASAWLGDASLLVATALRDHEAPVAYDLNGQRVTGISAAVAPAIPTLVLVPSETDFSKVPHESITDASSMTSSPGWVMTYSFIPDDHEGWMMGDPEFETHVWRRASGASSFSDDRCTAAGTSPGYDQNGASWWGQVQILDSVRLAVYTADTSDLITQVWEDDSAGECVIRRHSDWLGAAASAVLTVFGAGVFAGTVVDLAGGEDMCGELWSEDFWMCFVFTIGGAAFAFDVVDALNPDDYVGQVVPVSMDGSCYNGNHMIVNEYGQYSGCVFLQGGAAVVVPSPPPSPPPLTVSISGPTNITQKAMYTWTANASGGSGGYTYQWSVHHFAQGIQYELGTAQSQQLMVYQGDGQLEMTVRVVSNGTAFVKTHLVNECIGNPSGCEIP